MRVLLVEDDAVLGDAVSKSLSNESYAVDWFKSGQDGYLATLNQVYDVILLDLGLPFLNGFEYIKRARANAINVPIIVLTVNDSLEDIVKALDLGADDYLIKPFRLPEVVARIRAQIRRSHNISTSKIKFGALELDIKARIVNADGKRLNLSPREFAVLEKLIINSGNVVSKETLIESLCNWDQDLGDNAIEVYIHRVRKKVEKYSISIVNVRGLGYMLDKSNEAS